MHLVRWNPMGDTVCFPDRVNRLFDQVFRTGTEDYGAWLPAVDLYDDGENLRLQAEIPGLTEKDIDIQLENNVLTIKGERKRENESREDGCYRSERTFGSFTRSFSLPSTVDPEKIVARYRNGILDLTLPKTETSKTRKIRVSTN